MGDAHGLCRNLKPNNWVIKSKVAGQRQTDHAVSLTMAVKEHVEKLNEGVEAWNSGDR